MAGKRIDPRTIDEQAILEIVSSKNDRINLPQGKCATVVAEQTPHAGSSEGSSAEDPTQPSFAVVAKQLSDYKNTFLQTSPFTDKKTLHIDRNLHHRISALVGITGRGATVSGFVNKVLIDHFEKHNQEVGALLDQYYKSLKH